jgi:hypothetical protein
MDLERILGGSPISIIIKLVAMSIVVGIVLSALGLTPAELFYRFDIILRRIYELGFGWVDWLFRYFLVGAVIVVPIWLIARLIGSMRKR